MIYALAAGSDKPCSLITFLTNSFLAVGARFFRSLLPPDVPPPDWPPPDVPPPDVPPPDCPEPANAPLIALPRDGCGNG